MPDVFVAPEEQKNTLTHKRVPLPSVPAQRLSSPSDTQEPLPPTPSDSEKKDDPPQQSRSESSTTHGGIPLFTSFWQNPHGVYFDTQEANEHILLFLRQHFITNIPWIFFTFVFLFVPSLLSFGLQLAHYPSPLTFLPPQLMFATILFYYIIVLTSAFTHFLGWYYNISLITPRRVLDIEMKDLVEKKVAATKISLVQDVENEQTGTLRTLFNYGDVMIQTAGAKDNFFINACPKPEVVVRTVETLIGKGESEGVADAT